jgi:Protein of unknown function (DUF3159)
VNAVEDHRPETSWRANPTKSSIVGAVLRRLVPYLVEATIIPTALFYIGLVTFGFVWGIVAAASWTYISVIRRLARRRPIPGLLMLATLGISLRMTLYLLNDNAFAYFVQPIARTLATALFFAISAAVGKPLVARFAADFCAFETDVRERPAIVSLFRRLTFLWAGAQATIAVINLTLLLTVPLSVFVGTASATASIVMCAGVVFTVSDAMRTARTDGLRTAVAKGGRLHAYVAPA